MAQNLQKMAPILLQFISKQFQAILLPTSETDNILKTGKGTEELIAGLVLHLQRVPGGHSSENSSAILKRELMLTALRDRSFIMDG